MEERAVETIDHNGGAFVGSGFDLRRTLDIGRGNGVGIAVDAVAGGLTSDFLLGYVCGRTGTSEFSDGEDWLPAGVMSFAFCNSWVAEASRDKSAFSPAVVDGCEMPVDDPRSGVFIELIADVNELLDGGNVDVVDGAEIEDDGFERWEMGAVFLNLSTSWSRIIPRSVPTTLVEVGICASC